MRISREKMLMEIAWIVGQRSTCNRLQVGAVIAAAGRIISTGYAGAPSGMPHCSPEVCNVEVPCTRTVHAEAGAIAYAARVGIQVAGAELYCTHCPCLDCAKLIINSGIYKVVYETPYRKTEGLELLRAARVQIETVQHSQLRVPAVPTVGECRNPVPLGEGSSGSEDHDNQRGPRGAGRPKGFTPPEPGAEKIIGVDFGRGWSKTI